MPVIPRDGPEHTRADRARHPGSTGIAKPKVRPGRPPRISRATIARAALAIGLDTVTMKNVAQHLGVDHSSLYRHVRSRDALVLAAVEEAVEDLDWQCSPDADWRTALETLALAVWRLYQKHPGLAEALRQLEALPPSGLRLFAEAVAWMEARGFPREAAILVLDSVMDMTLDSAVGWRRLRRSASGQRSLAERVGTDWSALAEAGPAAGAQIEAIVRVLTGDPEGWWRQKLALLLDGAEARLARGD